MRSLEAGTDLEHERCGGRRKVDRLANVVLWVVLAHVVVDHDCLGRALFTNEQHSLVLFGYQVDEELRSHVVHIGHQDTGVLRLMVSWVDVAAHLLTPVHPVA